MHKYLTVDDGLYNMLKQFRDDTKQSGEWAKLTDEDRKYVNNNIRDYEETGINLPKEKRDHIAKIA